MENISPQPHMLRGTEFKKWLDDGAAIPIGGLIHWWIHAESAILKWGLGRKGDLWGHDLEEITLPDSFLFPDHTNVSSFFPSIPPFLCYFSFIAESQNTWHS